MRFQGLDLNLLVTLDRLLKERNVSRAARKLGLSQSATSDGLARLREYFGDELLVLLGRQMVLTPRAVELAAAVRNVLMQVEGNIIKRPQFDPRSARREIRIIASDFMTIAALADALCEIKTLAPDLVFSIEPPRDDPADLLGRGEIDFLTMPDIYLSPDHPTARLFSDEYRAVVWTKNASVGDTLSLSEFLGLRHVAVRFTSAGPTFENWFVQRFASERQIEVTVGSYAEVPFLVVGTERVAMMHRRLAEKFASMMPLRLIRPPVDIAPITECIQWHTYNNSNACLLWVRDQMVRLISARLGGETVSDQPIPAIKTIDFAANCPEV
jgi:LysR family transcriptional regulator, nod-box dependent transcriptional activator